MFNIKLGTLIGAVVFVVVWISAAMVVPSTDIAVVFGILMLTVFLFAFEIVGVDVAAVSIMVLLGLLSTFGSVIGLVKPLVPHTELFRGFSSNAVISIIAVMIVGAGLDKTGLMGRVAGVILKHAGQTEARILPAVSGTVGFISSFMQNVGAAALFLPVVSRISARTGVPLSRLLMPMGFCAILGGTVTMIGSSPLILLNDLMLTSNEGLPEAQHMQPWSLFSVTPIGIALLISGIAYFSFAGRLVLPGKQCATIRSADTTDYHIPLYGLHYSVFEVVIPMNSPLVGKLLDDIENPNHLRVIAMLRGLDGMRPGPVGVARDVLIEGGSALGLLGEPQNLRDFAARNGLMVREELHSFAEQLAPNKSGIAELVIPPGSDLVGKTAREVWMRKVYGIALVALHRAGDTLREGDAGIRDMELRAGDVLVVHTSWEALTRLQRDRNFVVITTEFPHEELRPTKVKQALAFFCVALGLILFTDIRLSVALMTGAIGMILSGVLRIEEAYQAVSWKTVFLLASLIPLGLAVETSGTAAWIAQEILALLDGTPIWVIQLAIALLTTAFTLVMSNVGATVLLVPLAVNIAIGAGADPAVFALTVALAASNSFLLPTHQVNALTMGPGGYRVTDFLRAGGIMTVLFIVVLMVMMNIVF